MDWVGTRRLILSVYLLVTFVKLSDQQVSSGVSYEAALRSAVKLTSGISPPATRIVSEIQAFSEYLSPSYSAFDRFPVYTGCQEAFLNGAQLPGVYVISRYGIPPFRAWCDFDSYGGWMTVQRRVDGTVDFFREWTEYEKGFGNLWGEYWLGLDKMHQMTSYGVYLSIYMEDFEGNSYLANYAEFSIGDAVSQYNLTVSGYSGSAGDSFSYHSGYQFSTWNRDNDAWELNCAQNYMGAWWYGSCHQSNLNGRYERHAATAFASSNCWNLFNGNCYGLKVTIMKILA